MLTEPHLDPYRHASLLMPDRRRLVLKGPACVLLASTDVRREGHFDTVYQLITGKAELGLKDRDGRTALHEAATARQSLVTQLLLESRASVTATDKWGRTALHEAARSGAHEAAQVLMSYGASPNIEAPGFSGPVTPKTDAASFNRKKVSYILERPPKARPKLLLGVVPGDGGVADFIGKAFR